ncbi:hypothetical protein VD0002_g4898 [Verticillium dahliae]|uniref:Cytochrome P450 n=2 Tax=Verticillium TaxID=1036719 RepID=A0AA44WLE4_VERDA|nr:hypothetical protein BJF96_g3917 [Verticillium dahliae]PNH51353.1 hypothetical protein VD0003_g5899 [Verticillium dahliae]PNH63480.1 hypothetical protein VD0002_g4898 [Verticillium dahliae]
MKRPTRPGLVNWFLKGKFNKSIKVMRTYAQEMVDHRKAHPSLDGRNDLLSVLMNGKDPQTNQSLRESQVIDNIVSMPIGSSTAPALVSTAIYFLLKNPHVIVTARKEIEFVLAGGELTYAHLSQLHYIEGIMRESLRLSFAAPGFNIEPIPRENDTSPVVLGQGKYQVAHNQPMIIVLAGVNRDPAVFQDPLAFVPERMMGETFDNLPVSVKKWFGNGKRECIGKHYAWQWNMVALTKLIRGVNFAMVDPSYELKQDGWFNLRPVDFMVKVRPI